VEIEAAGSRRSEDELVELFCQGRRPRGFPRQCGKDIRRFFHHGQGQGQHRVGAFHRGPSFATIWRKHQAWPLGKGGLLQSAPAHKPSVLYLGGFSPGQSARRIVVAIIYYQSGGDFSGQAGRVQICWIGATSQRVMVRPLCICGGGRCFWEESNVHG